MNLKNHRLDNKKISFGITLAFTALYMAIESLSVAEKDFIGNKKGPLDQAWLLYL